MVRADPSSSHTPPSGGQDPTTVQQLGDPAVHAETLAADDTNLDTLAAAPAPTKPTTASRAPTVAPRTGSIAETVRQVMAEDAAPPVHDSLQRYAEVRELGRGGMGRVIEAQDRWLGRKVAVKHLLAKHDATLRRRFEQEALITAQLDHPGIPTIYERSARDDSHWYTMRLVEGETLSALLKRAPRYEDRLMYLPVLAAVAQTLAHAHEKGVIHRDIKPDNVIVGSHGQAVLLDWGIAKVRGLTEKNGEPERVEQGAQGMTLHGSILGTPAYMAPEQARGDIAAIDERCDVFALGAMLFHILTGRPPYQGASVTDVLAQARDGQAPDIDQLAPQASPILRDLVRSSMQTDPTARPANAGEFVKRFQGFMAAAMVQQPARGVERFVSAASWFGLIMCLLMALVGWKATPSLREMGAGAYVTLVFFVVGLLVALLEWRTAGKHHLLPIGLVMVGTTAITSIAGAEWGMLNVYAGLSQPDLVADAAKYREMFAVGSREATGNIPFGLVFALLQGVILALAWRRAKLSQVAK